MRDLKNNEVLEVNGGDAETGAALGFIVAGPIGAAIGAAIGTYLASQE